jgi:MarR family transcriptional regulator, organic hydroperoxide resistance regulator
MKNQLPFVFKQPEDSPGFLLWQTTTTWQRLVKNAIEPYNISHAQFVIMATLLWFEAHKYDTTQVLIAQWSKLDKMTVSKSLKVLAHYGFVNRTEHKTDTRAKIVSLTDAGKKLVHTLVPVVEKVDEEFFGKVSCGDQEKLIKIFRALGAGKERITNTEEC